MRAYLSLAYSVKQRARKHLLDYLLDVEFSLLRLVSGKGSNQDFTRMTPDEQEQWVLFVRVIQAQIKSYEYWLMDSHARHDPHGNDLSTLPRSVAGKIEAVKAFAEQVKQQNKELR